MPQSAHTYTATLTSSSMSSTAFKVENIRDDDPFETVEYSDTTIIRKYDVAARRKGTVTFTFIPDTAGGAAATELNSAVEAGELFTMVVTQVALAGESAAPSTDNPVTTYTGYIFQTAGAPVGVGDIRQYDLTMSIVSKVLATA